MIRAKKIEAIVKTRAIHVLYREDGKWYMNLKDFPGALFDISGYIVFPKKIDYEYNKHLKHGKRLNISGGISQMREYQRYTEEESKRIIALL